MRRKHLIALFVGLAVVAFTAYFIFSLNLSENLHPDNLRQGITIEKIDWNDETGQVKAYVRNFGYSTAFSEVYVNGELDDQVMIVPLQIARNQTAEITLSKTYAILPKQITIEVHTTNSSTVSRMETFIGFEMLRLYWNESTQRIVALVTDIGSYPEVDFDRIYVNGILDDAAVVKLESNEDRGYGIYKISLSGIYPSKPNNMLLKITTADGTSFDLTSPFAGVMDITMVKWNQDTGQISFLAYIPSAHYLEKEQDITFDKIYVNGTKVEPAPITRPYSETYEIVPSKTYATCPSQVTIKAVTDFGAFCEQSYSYTGNFFQKDYRLFP